MNFFPKTLPVREQVHTTTYARADRDGRVRLPLRYAYVPTHPMPATLTVVARTASGTVRRRTPITLLR